jgi:hypothetical protein
MMECEQANKQASKQTKKTHFLWCPRPLDFRMQYGILGILKPGPTVQTLVRQHAFAYILCNSRPFLAVQFNSSDKLGILNIGYGYGYGLGWSELVTVVQLRVW